jgi:putative sigma-54 modulation protein
MLSKIELTGVHTEVTDELRRYVNKKIGKLDKYIPKYARESAHAEVLLKESKAKNQKQKTCEVILHLPHENIAVKDSTMNMFAAIDIAEAKLKNQLKKYKDTHRNPRLHQKMLARLRRAG